MCRVVKTPGTKVDLLSGTHNGDPIGIFVRIIVRKPQLARASPRIFRTKPDRDTGGLSRCHSRGWCTGDTEVDGIAKTQRTNRKGCFPVVPYRKGPGE